ncbi:MAG: 3-oxoacyl-[acyl-carrier-protein] synthase III C-terminal domain-containing protein [Oligoflexales bacterium]
MFKIKACEVAFPERIVSNTDVLDVIAKANGQLPQPTIEKLLSKISRFFDYSGIESRRWLEQGGSSFPLILNAVESALRAAGSEKDEIGMVIFAGIDRKVIEPGFSFLVAKMAGLKSLQCFDVLEACNGWVRAVDIAQNYFRGGFRKQILIVTAEFLCHEGALVQKSFTVSDVKDLDWSMASMTLGESATATILAYDSNGVWDGELVALPEYCDLCYCILDGNNFDMHGFSNDRPKIEGKFASYAQRMNTVGMPVMSELMANHVEHLSKAMICFPHAHSIKCWTRIAKTLALELPYYFIFRDYGNLATSSIPAALSLAFKEGAIVRGDRFSVTTAAAGMSFGVFHSIF